jgi:hypothetical protein
MRAFHSRQTRVFRAAIQLIWLALFAGMVVAGAYRHARSESSPMARGIVRGHVTLPSADSMAVESAKESSVSLVLGKDASMESTVHLGDKMEVVPSSSSHPISIRKANP